MEKNYQLIMEKIISTLDGKPKLLLHSCCGPCSSYVIDYLKDYFTITVLYYNPNIYPETEYNKRKAEQIKLLNKYKIELLDCDYNNEEFENITKGLENEKEGGKRCEKCFYLRLSKTKEVASKNNYDYFTTTLTVSPHKNSEIINSIGSSLEDKKTKYLYSDFKKRDGYKKSIELSKKYKLYRQNYCGCKWSNTTIKEE